MRNTICVADIVDVAEWLMIVAVAVMVVMVVVMMVMIEVWCQKILVGVAQK